MRGNPSTPGHPDPGPEHNVRTTVAASAVAVLLAFGLVLAVSAPLAAGAGVLVLATTGRLAGPVADRVRRRLRPDGRPRRVCVPYADVCVEV